MSWANFKGFKENGGIPFRFRAASGSSSCTSKDVAGLLSVLIGFCVRDCDIAD